MTCGPLKHWDLLQYGNFCYNLALDTFDHFTGFEKHRPDGHRSDAPVQVAILTTTPTRWVGFTAWPPPPAKMTSYKLGDLRFKKFGYMYDPENPTPCVGGPSFNIINSGRKEQSELEAREDVITFTGHALSSSMYVCGDVFAELDMLTTNPYTDVFVKLCDVDEHGQSFNLVENIIRLDPTYFQYEQHNQHEYHYSSKHPIRIKVGPIAVRFQRGHAFRLQISGGAHPLYMRNMGTGHPIADAIEMRPALHKFLPGSKILLPTISKDQIDLATIPNPAFNNHVVDHAHEEKS